MNDNNYFFEHYFFSLSPSSSGFGIIPLLVFFYPTRASQNRDGGGVFSLLPLCLWVQGIIPKALRQSVIAFLLDGNEGVGLNIKIVVSSEDRMYYVIFFIATLRILQCLNPCGTHGGITLNLQRASHGSLVWCPCMCRNRAFSVQILPGC